MAKILIVEDESPIANLIRISLTKAGHLCTCAGDGAQAAKLLECNPYDLILLDIMLPEIDGMTLMGYIRPMEIPVIFITAKGAVDDRVKGLRAGAEDYIVKPFNPLEVVLRVKALLRRLGEENREKLELGPFIVDLYSQKLLKNNIEIDVTPKEYLLMKIFLENPNKAFSRDELLDLVWGKNYFGDAKIIDVNIRRLRAKIEDNPSSPNFIETVWGIGYRWKIKE